MSIKLNTLLAKTDLLAASFRAMISDYVSYFRSNQGDFKGERKTYEPRPGTIDVPGDRGEKRIVTTVDEKLTWLLQGSHDYIDSLFALEATNACGIARAELVVDTISWGTFSSLELLRLKSLVENGDFEKMYTNIPVRSDSEIWNPSSAESYSGRTGVFESPLQTGVKKSTMKESYILNDPNIDKIDGARYTPQLAQKDTTIELGDYSFQKYSGEWSHRQKAELLRRRQVLLTAITEALKVANDVEAVNSELTADRIFRYLHG